MLFLPSLSAGTSSGQEQARSPSTRFEALAKSATAAREAERLEDAIRDYQRALEIRPDWVEGWWYLGTTLYDADRYAEAIPAFQKLVSLVPGAGPGWNFLGLCEYETKEYANSLEHLKKGKELGNEDDPEIARVSAYHLALLLNRSGQFEEAESLLAGTFAQSQISPQVKFALGLALLRVPLVPAEVDPSHDALIQGAGEAASAIAQNDSAKTLREFSSLLRGNSRTPYLHFAYGNGLAAAGREEEALAQQQEEIRLFPKSALPWSEMSRVQLRLHRPGAALHAAEEGVKLAPNSSAAHAVLGAVLQESGNTERARAELELAARLAPEKSSREMTIANLYSLHAPQENTAVWKSGADQANGLASESFNELASRATAAQMAGNADLAIESYQLALQLRPQWDDGRSALAMLLYSTRHFPGAISALKVLVEQKPKLGVAWAVMGLSEFETNDYSNALIHLQRSKDLGFGGSSEVVELANYRLAILLNQSGRFEEAIQTLAPESGPGTLQKEIQIALGMALLRIASLPAQVKPRDSALVESAGDITKLLLSSKYDQAYPRFQGLLKEYPTIPFLHYAYGTALAALSQYDEAEVQLRKELEISPASELPSVELASIMLKQRRPADAMPCAQRAVALAPESYEVHYILGRAFLDSGQEEEAVHELEVAGKLAPGSPKIHFNLARAYTKANMPEKARAERAIFARLNALAEQQSSLSGNQAYGVAQQGAGFVFTPAEADSAEAPQHP